MKLRKFLLTLLTLTLLISATACNFNTDISFGDPEVPTADIDKPTEEVTQIPTEEPTEKPTEPIITIDGITFDETLKTKLDAAKTYAEVCEILGKEGKLVKNPEVVYYWRPQLDQPTFSGLIKFKDQGDGPVVCEDVRLTNSSRGIDLSNRDQSVIEQITIGKSFEEIIELCGKNLSFDCGENIKYEWDFGNGVVISANFINDLTKTPDNLSISYFDFWDSDRTNTISDVYRTKLKLGQTYAELCEMFGKEGYVGELSFLWAFEDGKQLILGYYIDTSDKNLSVAEQMKYNGVSRVVIAE